MRIKSAKIWIAALALMSVANLWAGEKTFGLRAGYNTRNESPLAGLFFQYGFSDHLRLSPNIDYFFRHDETDALSMNCNLQFPFRLSAGGRTAIYPLGGLNYTSWNYHHKTTDEKDDDNDVSTRRNRFGVNLGGGFEVYATPTLKLSLEAKATFIKSYTSGTFSLSIGYIF